jgi:hypothetical protein
MFFWIRPIQNTFERAAYNQPKLRTTAISVTTPIAGARSFRLPGSSVGFEIAVPKEQGTFIFYDLLLGESVPSWFIRFVGQGHETLGLSRLTKESHTNFQIPQ